MSSDQTQQQTSNQLRSSEDLSLRPKSPPAQIPGYEIESLLGAGAYGEVWLALDSKTNRKVAVKFYTRQSSLDFSLLSQEVEKLVFLSADRYVVQLLDVGWEADPPYYVMDYIENGSLEDELSRHDSLHVEEAVELTKEVGVGLMHLHGKGILHCDLKPGNVLLDQDKKPRLADFGQSRLSHEQAPALGTLFFMAPEQADLKAAPDARWDVYALGALLYCMLLGRPPFRDEQAIRKIESSESIDDRLKQYRLLIQNADKPTEHRKVPGVDRRLGDIIDRCIARNPKERYPSVQDFIRALHQRELAQAKRPLMILGLIGPLLLMGVLSVLAWNAYWWTMEKTDNLTTGQTLDVNRWVAQLAARSAAEQIERYFRVVTLFSDDPDLQKQFKQAVHDPEMRRMIDALADPLLNGDAGSDGMRRQLIEHPARAALQQALLRNMNDSNYLKAASWFVCDHTGTQIASVFNQTNPVNTIGKNYAYRPYFTGRDQSARLEQDGVVSFDVARDLEEREHISATHMSAVFQSKATGTWKLAFSSPVLVDGEFLGIVAVTVEMGSFVEFENNDSQYVMLIDARPGEFCGMVLEHPLLPRMLKSRGEIPASLSRRRIDSDALEVLTRGGFDIEQFVDPMSRDPLGEDFDKNWIAAWADVNRRIKPDANSKERAKTGLKVIAVKDFEKAIEPARKLGEMLASMGGLALVFFLVFTTVLLIVVYRAIQKGQGRVQRLLQSGSDSSSFASLTGDSNRTSGSARRTDR